MIKYVAMIDDKYAAFGIDRSGIRLQKTPMASSFVKYDGDKVKALAPLVKCLANSVAWRQRVLDHCTKEYWPSADDAYLAEMKAEEEVLLAEEIKHAAELKAKLRIVKVTYEELT